MACYHPIPAYQDRPGGRVVLWPTPIGSHSFSVPCGTCLGCRTDKATEWAHRAELEATQWEHNCFLTLTYDDEKDAKGQPHLPEHGHLRPKDLQKFFKRLRRARERDTTGTFKSDRNAPIRYLASGEYGEKNARPHFHILLFNLAFADAKTVGKDLRESATLARSWRKGAHRIGTLTGASANYVAQYSLKKLVTPEGEIVEDHSGLRHIPRHDENGEVYQPPFIRMSLKPPIGETWVHKYKQDLQHGYLIRNARKNRIPRGLKKQLHKIDPHLAETASYKALQHKRTQHDLRAAEVIHESRNKLLHNRPL